MAKRDKKDIWQGLYEFPLIETSEFTDVGELIKTDTWRRIFKNHTVTISEESKMYSHKLSHQTIQCVFIKVTLDKPLLNKGFQMIERNRFHEYPVSRLIDRYIEENGL